MSIIFGIQTKWTEFRPNSDHFWANHLKSNADGLRKIRPVATVVWLQFIVSDACSRLYFNIQLNLHIEGRFGPLYSTGIHSSQCTSFLTEAVFDIEHLRCV